ncbi:MAG: hypothetical protein SGPRY_003264 [Prymnesium sp.]
MAGLRQLQRFYGDLEGRGEVARAISLSARGGQMVLLHGNLARAKLLLNLVAQLREHAIEHVLMLSFVERPGHPGICELLERRGTIGSSWLTTTGPLHLRTSAQKRRLSLAYLSWLQRFRYLRLFLERAVDVLALDSDVSLLTNPYPMLNFGELKLASLITTFDYKGGFANTNIGFMYFRNCSLLGPVRALLLDFEQRIAGAMALPPSVKWEARSRHASQFLWDQNVWNKALLSALVGR